MLKKSPLALVLIIIFPFAVSETIIRELAFAYRNMHLKNRLREMWRDYKGYWRELVDEEE